MNNDLNENKMLQSPLVVHKETDASYQETANDIDVDITHIETEAATLERHRFKKENKKSKAPVIIAVILVVAVALAAYLYFGKGVGKSKEETTTMPESTAYYTPEENKFAGIITVKGSYLFFEGTEIDGVEDLVSEIKYLDAGTKFIVQDESADSTFLNEEVLTTLSNYNIEYEVKYIISSGLISQYETTAAPETETVTEAPAEETQAAESE